MLRQLSRISVVVAAMLLSVSIGAGPIHDAAKQGNVENVTRLLNNGADPNEGDYVKRTPLHFAAGLGHENVTKILLESGADVNAKDDQDETPLHITAGVGHEQAAKVLLVNGADVNARDDKNRALLHKAASSGCKDAVKTLLANGAYLNIRNRYNETPAALARKRRHQKVLQVIRDSLRVKEENLAKSECVLAGDMKAKMWKKLRKGQLTAIDAGARIECILKKRRKKQFTAAPIKIKK